MYEMYHEEKALELPLYSPEREVNAGTCGDKKD